MFKSCSRMKPIAAAMPMLTAGLMLAGCGGGDDNSPRTVSLAFTAKAGNAAVSCGTAIAALGTGALQSQLKDLRFYVSDVKLIGANGVATPLALSANDWQDAPGGVTLIDLENATGTCAGGTTGTNDVVVGTVPAGNYVGLSFSVGVPSSLNHSDFAAAKKPLDIQAMAWSWQAGRKFIKIEVNPTGGVVTPGSNGNPDTNSATWNMHLGSTGCTGNPATGAVVDCTAPNRVNLSFAAFNPDTQQIAVDIQQLFLNANLNQNLGGALGCMSGKTDPECPGVFPALGLDLSTGHMLNNGANQTVFKAVAK